MGCADGGSTGRADPHEGIVNSIAFSPEGTRLLTASVDDDELETRKSTALLWDVETIVPKSIESLINQFAKEPDPTIGIDTEFRDQLDAFQIRRNVRYRQSTAMKAVADRNWFVAAFHLPWLCEQQPKVARWHEMLTQTYAEQGKWSEAWAVAEHAIDLEPSVVTYQAQLHIALALDDRNQFSKAANEYLDFAEVTAEVSAKHNAARYIGLLQDIELPWDRICILANNAVASNEESPAYCETLGATLYRSGHFDQAKKTLTKALDLFEANAPQESDVESPIFGNYYTHVFLALTYHRLNEQEKSEGTSGDYEKD